MTSSSPEPLSVIQLLLRGKKYMKSWPEEKRLSVVFPENRVIVATKFAIRAMPPIAIFTLTWQIALQGQFGPAVATALFACSLPLQGLWWLGKRSITPLPPTLLTWFYAIYDKLLEAGCALAPIEKTPDYQLLAEILRRAFQRLDHSFIDDL